MLHTHTPPIVQVVEGQTLTHTHTHTIVQVVEVVDALEEQRLMLSELQADAGLARWNDSLLLDLRFAGIVEAWASGATWPQVGGLVCWWE